MKISSPTNMHFVPHYKMKNKSSKRLTLGEGALKSFEPSILYWNSFYSIPDSRSTIWAPIQISPMTLWSYLSHWRTILVRFLFIDLKSASWNKCLLNITCPLVSSFFLYLSFQYLRRTIMSSLFQAKHPYFLQPFFIQHGF